MERSEDPPRQKERKKPQERRVDIMACEKRNEQAIQQRPPASMMEVRAIQQKQLASMMEVYTTIVEWLVVVACLGSLKRGQFAWLESDTPLKEAFVWWGLRGFRERESA